MCRKLALAATAVLLATTPAFAADPKPAKPELAAKPIAAPPAAKPEKPVVLVKATPAQRQMMEREEPMARAAFWAREFRLDPTDAEAGLKFAAVLRVLGNNEEAAKTAEQVSVLHPNNAEAYLAIARARIAANDGFFAITPARTAQTLNPKDWRPLNLLGVAYELSQRDDKALESYNQALALAPNNPNVLTNLALLYARKNDAAQAEKLLRLALAQPKATPATRQNLAQLIGKQGRLDEARKLMIEDLPPEVVENNLRLLKGGA